MAFTSLISIALAFAGHVMAVPTDRPVIDLANGTFVPAILHVSEPPAGFVRPAVAPPAPTVKRFTSDEFQLWAANATTIASEPAAPNENAKERRVIGTDDRYVQTSSAYPFGSIGRILISDPSGYYLCSGTLVGPRLMAAARHCIIETANWFQFQPGYDNGDVFPSAYVTLIVSLSTATSCALKDDWALYVLDQPLGTQRGYLGTREYVDDTAIVQNKPVLYNAGYPGDKSGGGQLYMSDSRTTYLSQESSCDSGPVLGDCDVSGGMSGGPLWRRDSDSRWTYGTLYGAWLDGNGNELSSIHAHGAAFVQGVNNLNAMYPN